MQAKELKPGDKFTVWEHERHTVCLKTEDGHTYRVRDGSVIRLFPTKSVDLIKQEEVGYTVAEYQGRLVLAKQLPGKDDATPRYVIKPFVPLETAFVMGAELRGLPDLTPAIRTEANTIPPQLLLMVQELENALNRGTGFLQVVKLLLAGGSQVTDVYHNPIMVNLGQLAGK